MGKSEKAVAEIQDLRKKVSEAFGNVKKMMVQFNSAALFFIGINVHPLNTRLKEFLTTDDFGLKKQRKRKERMDRKLELECQRKKGNGVDTERPVVVRQPLFEVESGSSAVQSKSVVQVPSKGCKRKKTEAKASDQVVSVVTKVEKHSGAHANKNDVPVPVREKKVPACSVDALKKGNRSRKNGRKSDEKYTEDEMKIIEAELSPTSDEEALSTRAPATDQESRNKGKVNDSGKKFNLKDELDGPEDGEILEDQFDI